MKFEWDSYKEVTNLQKHGLLFEDAAIVFGDEMRTENFDGREAYGEDRFKTVGLAGGVELAVLYTMRGDAVRIISARKAEPYERHSYWENR